MLNTAQFSAAKSAAEGKLMQAQVFDEEGNVKSFSKFKKDATEISDISQETWLRVERDMCVRQAVQGESFRRMQDDSDLYPFWVYKGVMDDREREDHVELEDQVFRIGDPAGDACYPPNDWNCRCSGESIDEDEVGEKGYKVNSDSEASKLLEDNIDDQFRYNSAVQGTMPNTGSYFDAMGSANEGNTKLFHLGDVKSDNELEGLSSIFRAATGLHYMIDTIDEWRDDYHINKKGDVIFQNKELYSNIRFTNNSLHEIQKHSRGFENIPATVQHPDEVWGLWENEEKQLQVLKMYIKFGKVSYLVQTKDGIITDAFSVNNKQLNKYRKGILL